MQKSVNYRINKRATSAGLALWAVTSKVSTEDRELIERELTWAFDSECPSTRLASVLTAEIILRRYGAAL